jgi:hypothetical protein
VSVTAEVDVLEHQVSPPHLVVALLDGGDVAPLRGDPGLSADGLNGIDDGLARKLLERLDRLAEELAEPRLPLLFLNGRVGEARQVSCPGALQPALLVLRAVGLLCND